jgi:hypothetical protein
VPKRLQIDADLHIALNETQQVTVVARGDHIEVHAPLREARRMGRHLFSSRPRLEGFHNILKDLGWTLDLKSRFLSLSVLGAEAKSWVLFLLPRLLRVR